MCRLPYIPILRLSLNDREIREAGSVGLDFVTTGSSPTKFERSGAILWLRSKIVEVNDQYLFVT